MTQIAEPLASNTTIKAPDEQFRLRVHSGNDCFEVRVLDVSKNSLRVSWSNARVAIADSESAFYDSEFLGIQDKPLPLRLKVVARAIVASEEEPILQLEGDDDRTRANLWLVLEYLRERENYAGGSHRPKTPEVLPKIPARGLHSHEARHDRLSFIRRESGQALDNLSETSLRPERLSNNIENLIGAVEVPVGLAGPLWFRGENARGFVFAPFATTEGALVASASRGATALSQSGGVVTRVLGQRLQRVPVFILSDMRSTKMFSEWVTDHTAEIMNETRKVSQHANPLSIEPRILGKMVQLHFVYETGDAAGQNMVTACTWHACQWILAQMEHFESMRVEHFVVDGNLSGDKKVTFNSLIYGRGTRVMAEALISDEVLEKTLKISRENFIYAYSCALGGSVSVGMVGFNVNLANTVAAIFAATGQDIASVHESSVGQLHIEEGEGGVYVSLLLPALIVGTVGGGTHLPRQQELLSMMGCAGEGKSKRLAEVVAGYALALELSTFSAMVSGQFASAHERLGRNRPVQWFQHKDLNSDFFEARLQEGLGDKNLLVEKLQPVENFQIEAGNLSDLITSKVDKLVGHFPFDITYRDSNEDKTNNHLIVKAKPIDDEVLLATGKLASFCGEELSEQFKKHKDYIGGIKGSHVRELGVYAQTDPRFRSHVPGFFGQLRDDNREIYILLLERLQNVLLMDSADNPDAWSHENIETVIRGIAQVHSIWLNREEELSEQSWLGSVMTATKMVEMTKLWETLASHGAEEFPEILSQQSFELHLSLIRNVGEWWPELEAMPRTLIHNDFTPRNLALRQDQNDNRLCAYDWELATLQVPQHDLAEFLSFVIPLDATRSQIMHYVELHRQELEKASCMTLDPAQWLRGFELSTHDLLINRFALYMIAHTFREYNFMESLHARAHHLVRTLRSN